MKLRNLFGLMVAGTLVLASCKKDDNGGGGGNNNTTPVIASLSCATATISDEATAQTVYSGTATVPYTGGNGATYANGGGINSTGVTGLTATLVGDVLASGNGNAVFAISGTPATAGTASFAISLGGQSCTLNLTVNAPLPHVGKWFYEKYYDSVFCCLSTWRANRTLTFVADSSGMITNLPQNQFYVDLKQNNSFTELWFDNTTYNGNYVIGADSLRFNYSDGSVQRNKVLTLNATALVFADRSNLYRSSPFELQPGDTLLSRLVWYMKK
jgi:hypothetical protein